MVSIAIDKIVKEFEETGVVTNVEGPVHHRFARSVENNAIVSESVGENPKVSIPRRSMELGLSYGTLWRIFRIGLHLQLYKVRLTQQLKPADHSRRRRYVEWMLKQQAVDGNFSNKIFFNTLAHFILGGMLIQKIVVFRVLSILK